jgi:multidrug efflux pump subunit AcrA (membrane-fusion protein)
MDRLFKKYILLLLPIAMLSCRSAEKKEATEEKAAAEGTPVTITTISTEPLTEYIDLNATATFMQKSYVKANVNGYIESVKTQPGNYVNNGQELFMLITKEAKTIHNSVNKLDPSFKFSGVNIIKTNANGYVTQLNHQTGDYVQDGEQLAVISDESSFAFLLNLPYELRAYMAKNSTVDLTLPDGTKLKGIVSSTLPSVDPAAQTQGIVIKIPSSYKIPENLIAKVRIVKTNRSNVISLPKAAVLTNDVQNNFWVMQLIDSNTAVKVPIKKGLETNDRVEITEPQFKAGDKMLLTGNFGLPDTAKVKIQE